MAGGGDGAFRVVMQMFGDGADQFGRHQRLVALHIYHDGVVRPALLFHYFGDAVCAAGVGIFGQACLEAMLMHDMGNRMMVGGNPDLLCAALCGLFRNPYHHRFPGDRQQRVAGHPGGTVARRDDDMESDHQSFSTSSAVSLRASSASITGISSSMRKASRSALQISSFSALR